VKAEQVTLVYSLSKGKNTEQGKDEGNETFSHGLFFSDERKSVLDVMVF